MLVINLSNYQKKFFQKKCGQLLFFLLIIICQTNSKAQATPRGIDVFSINSQNRPAQKTNNSANNVNGQNKDNSAIVNWFAKFDQLREQYRPTEKDKIIITRPLMKSAERVQQWTDTASKISKNYLLLAKSIRTMTVPAGMSDVKEYRDLMADWYQDSASVYVDLIKPRPPAKTKEDLQEEIDAVKKRAEGLANNMANLKNMDREVREAHKVPLNVQEDAVQQFIRGK